MWKATEETQYIHGFPQAETCGSNCRNSYVILGETALKWDETEVPVMLEAKMKGPGCMVSQQKLDTGSKPQEPCAELHVEQAVIAGHDS
ncbi:hypothetical protein UY3_15312 [Chelonia mydas]|uniref:Uncharacterized protein n=1 Tax=Chelonia mydas TaxID=8469 RepID=M7ASH1_CHEMY|nr:hypothetical protein UY3_15312 [Chelonia mydas]